MKKFLNPWVIAGTVITASLLLMVAFFVSGGLFPAEGDPYQGGGLIMIIPVPTATRTPPPTMTPTIQASPTTQGEAGIQPGGTVRITGTEGEGLRLRLNPSLSGEIAYLGLEGEIFLVKDGPIEEDGYLWWQLEAPLNSSRRGWVVADYLQPVQNP